MIIRFFLVFEILIIPAFILYSILKDKTSKYNHWSVVIFYKFLILAFISTSTWLLSVTLRADWHLVAVFLFIIILIASIATLSLKHTRKEFISFISNREFLTFIFINSVLYLLLNYLRSFRPQIEGTEKFMDMAFMTSFLKQKTMPAENPWLSGIILNYYYLGQLTVSILSYISLVPPYIGYNLAISLWGIMIFQAFYASFKVFNIPNIWSYMFAFLLTFGGNFVLLDHFMETHSLSDISFSTATRVISYTINEFCAYSIYLGDLHGHYLSFPFLISLIAFIIIIINDLNHKAKTTYELLFFGIILGSLTSYIFGTNAWDILVSLEIITVLSTFLLSSTFLRKREFLSFFKIFKQLLILAISYIINFTMFYLLFTHFFIAPLNGIGIKNALKTDSKYWLQLWGQFIIIFIPSCILIYIIKIRKNIRINFNEQISIILFILGDLNILIVSFFFIKDFFSFANPTYERANTLFKIYYEVWFLLGLSSFTIFYNALKKLYTLIYKSKNSSYLTKKGINILLFLLIILFVLYKPKFYPFLITFIFYIVIQSIASIRSLKPNKKKLVYYIVQALFLLLFLSTAFAMIIYIPKSVNDFLGGKKVLIARNFENFIYHPSHKLNGELFIKTDMSIYDYMLLQKLKELTKDKPVTIVEYIDYNSYTTNGRFSVFSGNKLIVGWPNHPAQWHNTRSQDDAIGISHNNLQKVTINISNRLKESQKIYSNTANLYTLQNIILEYDVQYILIGSLEQNKYHINDINQLPISKICNPIYNINNEYFILQCQH